MLKELLQKLDACEIERRRLENDRMSIVREIRGQETKAATVLKRFNSGDYVVNTNGRLYWVNDGILLGPVWPSERDGLDELVSMEVIGK